MNSLLLILPNVLGIEDLHVGAVGVMGMAMGITMVNKML